jgi:hypothetical protein
MRVYLQNNHSKKDWKFGLSGGEPALKAWSSKPSPLKKKKKKKVCEKTISRPGENICKSNILRTCIDKYINNPYKLIKRLCNYNMNEESE